ncbi:probable caffeine synthase 3 [Pistacia vera]|uniref:probable caffeine synthase 3 n=1 Tax=Pistacia vera TaxID=55513 RepID=UPI00126330A0|nr:probable caffeine synthase 3 [Pistacia vera]
MELKEVLHMNGGEGETSYANNSLIQKEAMLKAEPYPTQYCWSGRALKNSSPCFIAAVPGTFYGRLFSNNFVHTSYSLQWRSQVSHLYLISFTNNFQDTSLNDMVLEGLIEEDKLDQFNLPCYAPPVEEVKQMIRTEGSFSSRKFEIFTVDWAPNANIEDGKKVRFDKQTRGKYVAICFRVVTESLSENHFGKEVIDDLFERLARKIVEYLDVEKREWSFP